jgi:hypothetical protein
MPAKFAFFLSLLTALIACSVAEAGNVRRYYAEAPVKDCTRLNGRWGYYGNPWCTPSEQLRWDRWDARRR